MTRYMIDDISDFKFPFKEKVPNDFKRENLKELTANFDGPKIINLTGIDFHEGEYVSEINGKVLKYGKRRAYRYRNWTTSTHTHKWIIFSEISRRWILTGIGTEKPDYLDSEPREYYDEEDKVIGTYIEGISIEDNNVYAPQDIFRNDVHGETPIGEWYTNLKIPIDKQKADGMLLVSKGETSKKHYKPLVKDSFLKSSFLNLGKYYLNVKEGESIEFDYLTRIGQGIEKVTDKFFLQKEGELLYKSYNNSSKLLKLGDKIRLSIFLNGVLNNVSFEFDGIGSAIGSLNKDKGTFSNIGTETDFETTGSGMSSSDNTFNIEDKYFCPHAADGLDVAKSFQESTHSDFNYAAFDEARIEYIEGGAAVVSVKYFGFIRNEWHTLTLDSSPNSEPIASHPKFCDFAGDKDDPQNGAIFNDDGTFDKFAVFNSDGETHKFSGVTSYLDASISVRQKIEYQDATFKDLKDIGNIKDPDRDDATNISADNIADAGRRNWLCIGIEWEGTGKGCIVNKTFLLSGEGKWNTDIYS